LKVQNLEFTTGILKSILIQSLVCVTTGPQALPKRVLYRE